MKKIFNVNFMFVLLLIDMIHNQQQVFPPTIFFNVIDRLYTIQTWYIGYFI